MTTPRVERWERTAEWPLAAAAVTFLVAYAWPILNDHLSHSARRLCSTVDLVVWIVFVIDYAVRISIANNRWRYWSRHLPDLAMVALPALRPLRLLRLLMLLKVLNRRASNTLHGRIAMYVSGSAVILLFCASLAELDAERGKPGASIQTFGEALWWSFTTVSTVGYGDYRPVTVEGRSVAVGLMIGGVALLGVVTATFASWLIDRIREADVAEQAATRSDIELLTAEIAQLRTLLTINSSTAGRLSDKVGGSVAATE